MSLASVTHGGRTLFAAVVSNFSAAPSTLAV
jgi:hypothetical protein